MTMGKKIQYAACILCFAVFILALGLTCFLKEPVDVLESERRKAAQFPDFSVEGIMDKSYFDAVEDFLADQFPLRDTFRNIKATIQLKILGQKDNNGNYIADGHISELDNKLNVASVEKVAEKINSIYDKYIAGKNAKCYFSVVPDKNYYSAKENGRLSLDYEKMFSIMQSKMAGYGFIDIRDALSADSYYRTDLHWEQQKITDVAEELLAAMGNHAEIRTEDFTEKSFDGFKGAYYGQAALPLEPDRLVYLTNETLESCKVYDFEKGDYVPMYAQEKLGGVDSYDVYLHGARALMTIENPNAANDKTLVVFRDSFGSSLAPLLAGSYSKIILADIRYVNSAALGRFIEFPENCDVLFMYNTGTLNTLGQGSVS
jgi:hypothetical protein